MSDQPKHTGDMARLLPFTNERGEVEVIALGDVGPLIVAGRQSIATLTDCLGVMRIALSAILPPLEAQVRQSRANPNDHLWEPAPRLLDMIRARPRTNHE